MLTAKGGDCVNAVINVNALWALDGHVGGREPGGLSGRGGRARVHNCTGKFGPLPPFRATSRAAF